MSDTTRRAYQLGGLTVTVLIVAAVLIAVLSSSPATPLRPGKPVPGASGVQRLLAGIPQSGITLGSPRAPITLVEFADLQCPYCADFATRALPTIVSRFVRPGRLRLVFRNLDSLGSDSMRAAQMAAALGNQDHLWQFVELTYRNQGDENSGYVTNNYLRAIAQAIPGVDATRAMSERATAAVKAQLSQAGRLASQLKLAVTPSFLLSVNGGASHIFNPSSLESGAFTGPLQKLLAASGS